jgi:hypothetical protein
MPLEMQQSLEVRPRTAIPATDYNKIKGIVRWQNRGFDDDYVITNYPTSKNKQFVD